MCFFESKYDIKQRAVSKLLLGISVDIAIQKYTEKYPGDRIYFEVNGKYKKIIQNKYRQYCIEPLDDYWTNSTVIFVICDGIIVNIKIYE